MRSFFEAGKPAGVICHAAWILINAGLAEGRTLTSYKTIRVWTWPSAGVHVIRPDGGWSTMGSSPAASPATCRLSAAKLIEEIAEVTLPTRRT